MKIRATDVSFCAGGFMGSVVLHLRRLLSGGLILVVAFAWVAALSCQQPSTYILWPAPEAVSFLSPLTSVQLNAEALAGPPVNVPLQANYNVRGFATPGVPFVGGFDGNGESFSAAQIGSSLMWRGVRFQLGPPDAADAVSGGTAALPPGFYSRLLLLADLVNDEFPGTGVVTIHYSDGSASAITQPFSDWVRARNNPGEANVTCVPNRVYFNGSIEPNSTCVYGYSLTLDPSKTAVSVTLPDNRNIVVLAMALLPPVVAGDFAYSPAAGSYPPVGSNTLHAAFTSQQGGAALNATVLLQVNAPATTLQPSITWPSLPPVSVGTALGPAQLNASAAVMSTAVQVPLRDAARVNAVYHDGAAYLEKGFDGANAAFSYEQLGPAVQYQGSMFSLGAPDVQNAATSSTVQLPSGKYTALDLIGAATIASPAQPFTVHYADGTSSVQFLDMSAWTSQSTYSDETVVASTSVQNLSDGTQRPVNSHLYGYTLALDRGRAVESLTLPSNADVIIVAAGLHTGEIAPVEGSYFYVPQSGTVLANGVTNLHVDFSPTDARDFRTASADNTITALHPDLVVIAHDASRLYGLPNPVFSGVVTGALSGDSFTETYTTIATVLSPAGVYDIVPAVEGANLSGYNVTVVPAKLRVLRAASVVTLGSTQVAVLQGTSVGFNVTVTSTTSGIPSGTVTILANGKALVSQPLLGTQALLTTAMLPVGNVALSVAYSGDQNFLASVTPSTLIQVSPRDFLLSADRGTTLSGTMGTSPSLPFHLNPLNGSYSADAMFSVSGDLPIGAYATFSPDLVLEQDGPANVTLTLHTRKYALLEQPLVLRHLPVLASFVWLAPLLVVKRRKSAVLLSLLIISALVFQTGCGSGYAAHTYHFQLTATTGTVSHSVPLTLQIQASPQ